MKIGFFTDSYLPRLDGIAISVDTFRRGLEDLGHEVFVFCPHRPGMRPDDHVISFSSLPSLWYEGYRDTFPFRPVYLRRIRELQLDIIHTHTQTQLGLLGLWAAKKLDLPLVTTQHADLDLIYEHKRLIVPFVVLDSLVRSLARGARPGKQSFSIPHAWSRRYTSRIVARYNNACDLVTTPSPKMHRQLIESGTTTSIEVLPTGIDMTAINQDADKWRRQLRAKIGLLAKDVLAISTARLAPEKRVPTIVKSFLEVASHNSHAHLVVIGDGPDLPKLHALLHNHRAASRVHLIGRVPREEVFHWLHAADIYINICLRETQGLTISEAVAASLPVVIADDAISPVVIDHQNGYVIGSDSELLSAYGKLMNSKSLRQQFAAQSYKLAKTDTVATQAAKLGILYEKVLRSS